MDKKSVSVGKAKIDYFLHGEKPKVLISSGTHGDEPDLIFSVRRAVDKYVDQLPDFLYIPQVSPSAIALGTRKNSDGLDANRAFFPGTTCEETLTIEKILEHQTFDIHVDFHEDEWIPDFYIYDCRVGNTKQSDDIIGLLSDVSALGVGLFEGIDDLDNPNLGNIVKDGYCSPDVTRYDPSFDGWTRKQAIAKRTIVPEVPGKASQELKDKIVEVIFKNLLI